MKRTATSILSLCLSLVAYQSAMAGASDWFKTDGAKIRLIAMPGVNSGTLQAGLQFKLDKGWKTYWRSPGGSGIPPQIQFLGSKNVASTAVSFPVPQHFSDDNSVGYKSEVTFPIDVKLKQAGAPTTLHLSAFVGICSEICVPVQFQLSLVQGPLGGTEVDVARALMAAKNKLPREATDQQRVVSATSSGDALPVLTFKSNVPTDSRNVLLFVEGPSNWYIQQPSLTHHSGNETEFSLTLHDIPSAAKIEGTELKLTLVADGVAVEQNLNIATVKTP